jgi:hypothetical protein
LCYETSLLSLLNYGIVPNAISIDETRKSLEKPREEVPRLLAKARQNDSVRQANLRLRTVARETFLTAEQTRELWFAIAEFFDGPISSDEMSSWTPWVDVTHVWVRGALLNYLPHHPMETEKDARTFVEELINGNCMHLASQVLYFHIQAHGLFDVEARPNLHPKLGLKQTHELVEHAAGEFAKSIAGDEPTWKLRSCVPLWIIKCASEVRWAEVKGSLSNPKTKLFADGIAVLLLRTRREKIEGKALFELLDAKAITEAWRRLKGPSEERRRPVEFAYRFLHSLR